MKRYDTNEAASSQLLLHFLQHDALNGIIFTFVSLLKHIFHLLSLLAMKRTLRRIVILISVTALIGTSTSFYLNRDRDLEIIKSLDIFYSLIRELNLFYVDTIEPQKLIEKGINAMLASLDPYTEFISESELENFRFQTTGEYGGIGALIRRSGDFTVIAEPYEGFPAFNNGIRAGDLILEIDGKSVKNKEVSQVSEMLKGTPGTSVQLLIRRGKDGKEVKKKLVREKINIPNVPYYGMLDGKTGYINLSGFTTFAGKEVRNAVTDLRERGAGSIILDLRGNPGGLLIEAVNVVNVFIPKGQEVVRTRGKLKQFDAVYTTSQEPVDTLIPLVVLTSRGSASAAEIVAGTIQDLDRGVIVGQRTFGKGLVQTTRPLSYNTQLKVTTAKYYIPSGRCIQAVDYSHRNEDGSVGYIPDSLIRAFRTRHGRTVYDGGGIQPDVPVSPETYSRITVSLVTKNLVFNFATAYNAAHDSIPAPEKFSLSDADYQQFVSFLQGKDFDYQTESESKFQELEKAAQRDKYYDLAREEFEKLKLKISHDKNKDLQTFRNEISKFLAEEIVSRYYYQKGRIRASLPNDPMVQKALEVLKDKQLYRSVLDGSYGVPEKATSHEPAEELFEAM